MYVHLGAWGGLLAAAGPPRSPAGVVRMPLAPAGQTGLGEGAELGLSLNRVADGGGDGLGKTA